MVFCRQNLIVISFGLRGNAASCLSSACTSFVVSIAVWIRETNNMGLKTGHKAI
jgi:hypothetical protein